MKKIKFITLVLTILSTLVYAQDFDKTKKKLENPEHGQYHPATYKQGYPYTTFYKPLNLNYIEDIRFKIVDSSVYKVFQPIYKDYIYPDAEAPIDLSNKKEIGGEEKLGYGTGYSSYYAKHAAFVYLMGFDKDGEYLRGQQDPVKTQKLYSFRTTALIRLINLDYSIDKKDNIQWRSKELIHYLQTYDLLKAAGVESDSLEDAKYRLNLKLLNS